MALAGIRGTGDWADGERPKNFREAILWLQPNGTAPLTALLSRMASERVNDPEFNWWEERLDGVRLQVNGDINTTTNTVFIVSSGAYNLVAGDVLLVETSDATTAEIVRVTGVGSDTTFSVERSQAGTTAIAIASGVYLTRIGTTHPEASRSADSTSRNPTKKSNFAQLFKKSYQISKTAALTKTRTGDPLKNERIRKMFDHSTDIEFALMFGRAYETTGSNGLPMRFTGGLRHFITSNVTVFNTTPTEDTFISAVAPVFNYTSGAGNERIVFAGNGFLTSLNKLAKAGMEIKTEEVVKLYGMNLARWVLPQGTLYIKTHPLMNTHGRYTNSAFIIDPSALKWRYMRDTTFQDNIQENDADYIKGQWLTEAGIEVRYERTMAYIGNFFV